MNIWFLYKGAQTTLILVEIRYLMLQHTYLSSLDSSKKKKNTCLV